MGCGSQVGKVFEQMAANLADHFPCLTRPQHSLHHVLSQVAAAKVGQVLAQRAASSAIPAVHWDRKAGQRYHGKAAALLQSMQQAGLPLH